MRLRFLPYLVLVATGLGALAQLSAQDQKAVTSPAATIVCKGDDLASKLVNEWFRAGTAAGLSAVYYDNRDRRHSDLGISNYPQMRPITYTAEERDKKIDWGKQLRIHPGKVVIGNSSTASPANQAGSHQRMYYLHPQGLSFLYQQYRSNALYVYPEHRDHDPGTNGPDGYGDLYPANSPYLISSQGSSGSDKAFMHAFLKTIAAFPPETQEVLIKNGLLMPTVQSIFRRCYRALKKPGDYFSAAAHPSKFDGKLIDEVAMVKQAQAMTPEMIPPIAQLKLVQGTADLKTNTDCFERQPIANELLGTSPCSMAWIIRGPEYRRTIRLSAQDSSDLQQRELRYRWVILRGDPDLIDIKTTGANDAEATLTVAYHPRRPISPGADMWSNRVDIGVFSIAESNGEKLVSAPAFVSFTSLPNEHRSYSDDGRLEEIFYGARTQALGFPAISDPRWDGLLTHFEERKDSDNIDPGTQFIRDKMTPEQIDKIQAVARTTKKIRADIAMEQSRLDVINTGLQQIVDETNKVRIKANANHKKQASEKSKAELASANQKHNDAKRAVREGDKGAAELRKKINSHRAAVVSALQENGIPQIIRSTLISLRDNPQFFSNNEERIREITRADGGSNQKTAGALASALRRLSDVGAQESANPPQHELYHLRHFHLDLLSDVIVPTFLQRPPRRNYVDPRLTTAKQWRDVYRHRKDGSIAGWTRFRNGEITDFSADGKMIDGDTSIAVRYVFDPQTKRLEPETESAGLPDSPTE